MRLLSVLLAAFILPAALAPAWAQASHFPMILILGAQFTAAVPEALLTAALAPGSNVWRR